MDHIVSIVPRKVTEKISSMMVSRSRNDTKIFVKYSSKKMDDRIATLHVISESEPTASSHGTRGISVGSKAI